MKVWYKSKLLWILFISFFIRVLFLLVDYPLWWDSHVYIGISKYIYTFGAQGIWESFRPLVHPIILGAFCKAGFDVFFVGKLLDLVLSVVVVYLTYLVGRRVFSEKVALVGASIFAINPLFIMFTGLILTEPLAMVFGLLGMLLFFDYLDSKSYLRLFFSGVVLGLSFMTKFPQGIFFGSCFLVLVFMKKSWLVRLKEVIVFGLGFSVFVIPFLVLNYILYQNILIPFTAGSWIVTTATWLYGSGLFYYTFNLFISFPIFLFFFGYLYYFISGKRYFRYKELVLVLVFVLTFLYFHSVPRKEIRYLVTVLPMLSLFVGFAIVRIYNHLKSSLAPKIRPRSFIVVCIILIIIVMPSKLYIERYPDVRDEVSSVLEEYNVERMIITSDPSFVSFTNNKIVSLDGAIFALKKYEDNYLDSDMVFINDCDLACEAGDESCASEVNQLILRASEDFSLVMEKKFQFQDRACTYLVFVGVEE